MDGSGPLGPDHLRAERALLQGGPAVYPIVQALRQAAVAIGLFTIMGCGGQPLPPIPQPTPSSAAQAFNLYTHCGVDWRTQFDGSFWDLASPIQGSVGNPYQPGTMLLVDAQTARFEYESSGTRYTLTFRRHPAGVPLKPPAGCD